MAQGAQVIGMGHVPRCQQRWREEPGAAARRPLNAAAMGRSSSGAGAGVDGARTFQDESEGACSAALTGPFMARRVRGPTGHCSLTWVPGN